MRNSSYANNPSTTTESFPAGDGLYLELVDNTVVTATPEPGTLSLPGLGLVSMGGLLRAKARNAARKVFGNA